MINEVVLRQTIHVVFFLLIFAVKPAMSECPNIKDIKMVKSFGIEICAMPKVEDKYLNHAKKIMDKLVDYNGDGKVDNQKVIDNIIKTGRVFDPYHVVLPSASGLIYWSNTSSQATRRSLWAVR